MSRRDEQELAARLARVLDGEETPGDELASLATVLERATEPARFEISEQEVEQALATVRPRLELRKHRRRRQPRLVLAFGTAAAAALAVLVVTFTQIGGLDVEAKALAALGGPGTVLHVDERIVPAVPGTFPVSTRTVWLDPGRHREAWGQVVRGIPIETTLVENGRVSRYLPEQNTVIVASSCLAFASGCAEVLDPVGFYREALRAPGIVKSKRERIGGRDVYRLTLPVQSLPDAVPIEQRATIDAKTYLPVEIDWLEQRPGEGLRVVTRILVTRVERLSEEAAAEAFILPLSAGARIIQRAAPKAKLRLLGQRRLSLAEARGVVPKLLWLGDFYRGRTLLGVDQVRWNAGVAFRFRYDDITVWNYTSVIPPDLVAGRLAAPSKTLPAPLGVARFYSSRTGNVVAELERGGRSVAVVAPMLFKEDYFALIRGLRPLG